MPFQYNLGILFYSIIHDHGNRSALRYPDGFEIDYFDLNRISNRIARFLLENGLCKGDVIAIFKRNPI